jgi:hypothetical protein
VTRQDASENAAGKRSRIIFRKFNECVRILGQGCHAGLPATPMRGARRQVIGMVEPSRFETH